MPNISETPGVNNFTAAMQALIINPEYRKKVLGDPKTLVNDYRLENSQIKLLKEVREAVGQTDEVVAQAAHVAEGGCGISVTLCCCACCCCP